MTAITFPTDPANGELYTAPNGCVYIWDGEKWAVNSTIYTGQELANISQDRVAPMFVNGVNTGITFAYNSTTNVMTTSVADSDRLVNGVHEFTLESNGTVTLDGDPFTGFSGDYDDLANRPTIPPAYTLPTASTTVLGGVKVDGTTVTITDGVISSVGGGGSAADSNIWVQTFESQDGAPTDVVGIASSVEYDSAGNVIALFSHSNEVGNNYYSVGKYTTTGTKICRWI